ncbi:MAG: hypothetical protein E6I72_11745 [Chloroflexi bacterium]|nr:MAG: hypothetical protein E6I72_11745 [Chloroflexota bacterium]
MNPHLTVFGRVTSTIAYCVPAVTATAGLRVKSCQAFVPRDPLALKEAGVPAAARVAWPRSTVQTWMVKVGTVKPGAPWKSDTRSSWPLWPAVKVWAIWPSCWNRFVWGEAPAVGTLWSRASSALTVLAKANASIAASAAATELRRTSLRNEVFT